MVTTFTKIIPNFQKIKDRKKKPKRTHTGRLLYVILFVYRCVYMCVNIQIHNMKMRQNLLIIIKMG